MSDRFQEFVADPSVARPSPDWLRARSAAYMGFEGDALDVFAGKRVLLLAAGSVNRPAAELLTRLGVGGIDIVDPKRIKRESLLTHQGVGPDELGEFKAVAAARACAALGTGTRVRYFVGSIQDLSLADLAGTDVVIMAPDNLAAEFAGGEACLHLGIPLIHSSLFAEALVAQCRVYANADAKSPTPACGFTAAERELHDGQVRFSCEGSPAGAATPEVVGPATVSPVSLCSIAADLAVTQFLRLVLGLGEPVGDTMLEWCGYTHRTRISPLSCGGACRSDHARLDVVRLPRPLGDHSLAELAAQVGGGDEAEARTYMLGDLAWAERGVCHCGRHQSLGRFVAPTRPRAGQCPRCTEPIHCAPFFLHRKVSEQLVAPVRSQPLGALAESPPEWLLARSGTAGTLFLNPDHSP
jgi:molybdopterin/thiamine biosynthesis adenylyltransferase